LDYYFVFEAEKKTKQKLTSSITKIFVFFKSARAKQNNCLCPRDQFEPSNMGKVFFFSFEKGRKRKNYFLKPWP